MPRVHYRSKEKTRTTSIPPLRLRLSEVLHIRGARASTPKRSAERARLAGQMMVTGRPRNRINFDKIGMGRHHVVLRRVARRAPRCATPRPYGHSQHTIYILLYTTISFYKHLPFTSYHRRETTRVGRENTRGEDIVIM